MQPSPVPDQQVAGNLLIGGRSEEGTSGALSSARLRHHAHFIVKETWTRDALEVKLLFVIPNSTWD
jgi:hypothetical protein